MSETRELNEPILGDDYPVFAGYWYVMDGIPKQSDVSGNVVRLKAVHGCKEVRRCDAVERDLPLW